MPGLRMAHLLIDSMLLLNSWLVARLALRADCNSPPPRLLSVDAATTHEGPAPMNWITNYVRPRINSIFSRREVPENLWSKCDACGTMLFHRELKDNLNVCTNCGHHMPITPRARFAALFDGGAFAEVKVPEPLADPLQFRDQKKYPDRLRAAQKSTGEKEAMLVATGEMGAPPSWPRRRISPSWAGPWACMWATPSSPRPRRR